MKYLHRIIATLLTPFLLSFLPVQEPVPASPRDKLKRVKYWAYQIQKLDWWNAVDKLVNSRYDMLVLEPTRSDRDTAEFNTKRMVRRLHRSAGKTLKRKLVIAYIDIGEAEDWRWYWKDWWRAPTKKSRGNPDFLLTVDPDGWAGNYPVAYWDMRWQNIIIYKSNSALNQVLEDGFDGIYMDWVEAYCDESVEAAAAEDGVDPPTEMLRFIKRVKRHARERNPNFIIVQQNACELWEEKRQIFDVIDGIAQEHVFFNGEADVSWNDPEAGDIRVPKRGEGYSREYYNWHLKRHLWKGIPVFTCDYARKTNNVNEAYTKALNSGYVPYVSLTPLDRLTKTPPPGY